MTRKEARKAGLKIFYSGKKCPSGHLDARYVASGACLVCQKERNTKNKSLIRTATRKWRSKNIEQARAKDRTWYAQNGVRKREDRKKRYWTNPEKERTNNRRWRAENPEKQSAATKRWIANNPEQIRLLWKQNGALRRKVAGGFTKEDVRRIRADQRERCAYCRKLLGQEYHLDHIHPVSKGGLNIARNLQLTCVSCNKSKYNKDPIDFAQSLGMLL